MKHYFSLICIIFSVNSMASGLSCRSYFLENKDLIEAHEAFALEFQTGLTISESYLLQLLSDISKASSNHAFNKNLSELAIFNNNLLLTLENLQGYKFLFNSDSKNELFIDLISRTIKLFELQGFNPVVINNIIDSHFNNLILFSKPDIVKPIGFSLAPKKNHSEEEQTNPTLTENQIGFLRINVEKKLYGRVKPIEEPTHDLKKTIGFVITDHKVNETDPLAKLPTIGFNQSNAVDANYRNQMIFRSDLGIFDIKSNIPLKSNLTALSNSATFWNPMIYPSTSS